MSIEKCQDVWSKANAKASNQPVKKEHAEVPVTEEVMSPIEPDEAMKLKNFKKEEEAIFDFIVSPMMQKYLKSYIR